MNNSISDEREYRKRNSTINGHICPIVQLSDLHFGPHFIDEVGDAVLRFVDELDSCLVVLTGDITQRAKEAEFIRARKFLSRLPKKAHVLAIAGNHDIPLYRFWERMFFPYRLYDKYHVGERSHFYQTQSIAVAVMDSTHPWKRIKEGSFGETHLQAVRKHFQEVPPGVCRILATHHPLFQIDRKGINDPRTLRELLDMRVEIILCGHSHESSIREFSLQGQLGQVTQVTCGTSTSSRGRRGEIGRNSVNTLDVSLSSIRLRSWVYCRQTRRFLLQTEKSVPRPVSDAPARLLFKSPAVF